MEPLIQSDWDWVKKGRNSVPANTYEALCELGEMMLGYLQEEGYNPSLPPGSGSSPYSYAMALSLIESFENNQKERRVLDIGAGTGKLLQILWHFGYEGLGLDPGIDLLKDDMQRSESIITQMNLWKSKGFRIISGNIYSLPAELREQTFPITISINIFDLLDIPIEKRGSPIEEFFNVVGALT
jgi:SAM-dependent methyltransferase